MKARNFLSIAFMIGFAFFMTLFGAWTSNAFVDGSFAIIAVFLASFVAATIVWAIWNLDISVRKPTVKAEMQLNNLEKRKRDRIDSVLRDLSDEDLLRLRHRLLDGTINDERLEEALVGEDGELLRERR
jgi:hypothetical protein